ncbi:unnamed protein product [Vitrella brassicaformis CCMP3155]|uniref:Nuclear migration protein nudC n=2 Tax=Vitrella brassicaformis TaxID=1169539 RepID=A0A0G4EN48_VITBC|nr:unnamed protein product [Vitrella brassicaformis CCMP3155]|mmetsp:Transcript_39082/g.97838  ORF Transcript_39082/g.97838 Transcript_39082/m.97838 type:complete len:382 (+) Transcript_39082:117-1262(+)|eukprot:CEL98453.1 unnamed protein product [Vitrella brassicaformis CCMP3155]
MSDRYDDVLLGLARHHEGIEPLLETFFSFLERRTDFFHIMTERGEKMGFVPGRAEEMLKDTFQKYQRQYISRVQPSLPAKLRQLSDKLPSPNHKNGGGNNNKKYELAPVNPSLLTPVTTSARVDSGPSSPIPTAEMDRPLELRNGNPQAMPEDTTPENTSSRAAETHETPEEAKHISTWNGGETGRYRWSQTFTEVTVEVPVSRCHAKDITVDIGGQTLKVSCRGEVIVEGTLYDKILKEDSTWSLEDGERVVVTLFKTKETWWKCVIEGDPEIDPTKVESSKRIEDFDDETQGAIRKIVFDQNQKAQGLPTSDQIKTANLLKDAWDAEGSPFKGQPFDPAALNLQGNVPEALVSQLQSMPEQTGNAPTGGAPSQGSGTTQ